MRKAAGILIAVSTLSLTAPQPVRADPFVVGTPSFLGFAPDGDLFRFTGAGFEIVSDTSVFFAIEAFAAGGCLGTSPAGSPFNCRAGDLVDMSLHTPGEVGMGVGTATINGTVYADVSFFGNLTFTATPSLFPSSTDPVVVLAQPFLFAGIVRGVADGHAVFNVDLTGAGHTDRAFFRTADGGYNYQMESLTSYVFDPAAAATPEPASMLLVGTGVLGLLSALRRRRN